WNLVSVSGGVVAADLVAAGDNKSATFTGHVAGAAAIHVFVSALPPPDSTLFPYTTLFRSKLIVTLPGETFTAGAGNSGTVSAQTAGMSFNIVSITAADQFNNIDPSYSGAKTISYVGPGGSPSYTTSVNFTAGQSATALATT